MKNPFELTQLVVVRRDLPFIQIPVQGGHAIGKATYMQALEYAQQRLAATTGVVTTLADILESLRNPDWGHPYRMWCGVQNEKKLLEIADRLTAAGLKYLTVVEPDDEGGLKGQTTALATLYYEKEQLLPVRGDICFDLKFEQVQSFKNAAIALVAKQLLNQLPK